MNYQDVNYKEVVESQRHFFSSHKTLDVDFRLRQLQKLLSALKMNEARIFEALKADLAKPELEALVSEFGGILDELNFAMKHLESWAQPQRVATPLIAQPGKASIHPEPKGCVLIISPWNYPLSLALVPLIGAIAAGNCAILKPSEFAQETAKLIGEIIQEVFPREYIYCAIGNEEVAKALLKQRFDHIFFTGSTQVGKKIMQAAAEFLTPVTLELGGKSPCIVDAHVAMDVAVKRIVWGKFFNAGQTCIAPDYVLVHESIYEKFLAKLRARLREEFGEDASYSPDYARIINERHFERLLGYMSDGKIYCGGDVQKESRYIGPTVLVDVELESRVMNEEIFGPLLPVFSYSHFETLRDIIAQRRNPLALYLFTEDAQLEECVLREIPAGGVCVNDTLMHYGCRALPFGGRGESGMGSYHGKKSFDEFSHFKGVLHRTTLIDPNIRYRPYSKHMASVKLFY